VKIGITYDLRDDYLREGYSDEDTAEFDSVETISAIEASLRALGHVADRIGHVRALTRRLALGDRWDLVFNIAEGLSGFGREAQVPALLDAFGVPYTFSDPLVLTLALHKGMAKRVVRDLGIPTADFTIVERLSDVAGVSLSFPLFIKPVAEGTSKGISRASKVSNLSELRSGCAMLLERFRQPVLVEAFLPGRELTVGIVGTGEDATALGALEVLLQSEADPDIYSFANKQDYKNRVRYRVADDWVAEAACRMALAVWQGLGCRDGGRVDIRCDAGGNVNFLEVNPLAGLHPENSDIVILGRMLGFSHEQLIDRIVASATQRLRLLDEPRRELSLAARS
jgi:D-alanine-D-alanine ligase